jgi:hypothetical protein
MSSHGIWDKRTCGSAALSVILASGVGLTVCAAKGDLDTPVPASASTAVHTPSEAPTAVCVSAPTGD